MPDPAATARMQLAHRLRSLRRDRQLTQKDVADVLGGDKSLSVATVSSWESASNPALPSEDRLQGYARAFSAAPAANGRLQLPDLEDLGEKEREAYEELEADLLTLRRAALGAIPEEQDAIRKTWYLGDAGPATLVCAELPAKEAGPLANPQNPNYNQVFSLADLDALVELHGHLRAENPDMDVFFKASRKVAPDDLSGHLILLGGVGWNPITKRLLRRLALPVKQVTDPKVETGEIFVIKDSQEERKYLPTWSEDKPGELIEDVGLLARLLNPYNSSRTLTLCNGIHSRGVYGAVRTLTDARVREHNERYLHEQFGPHSSFAILMRVQVIEDVTMTPDFNSSGTVLYEWHEPTMR
jgi:transcriptional regulator with XRE-family HTH domain